MSSWRTSQIALDLSALLKRHSRAINPGVDDTSQSDRGTWREAVAHVLVPPILFFLCVKLSLLFAVTDDSIVMLWMPNGILLATLIHYGFKRYTWFVVGVLIAEVAADYPTFTLPAALAYGVINLAEATGAYALLRRLKFDPAFADPIDLGKFVLSGPMLAALPAAFTAGTVYVFFGGHEATYWNFVRVWWFSDGLGLLIITPLVLSCWPTRAIAPPAANAWRWYDSVVLGLGLLLALIFALAEDSMFRGVVVRGFLLMPFALYVATRFDLRATSVVIVAVSLLVLYVTHRGQDPFGQLPMQVTIISAQEFMLTLGLMCLGLNTLLLQQARYRGELEARVRRRTTELKEANTKLERLALTDMLTGLPNRRALMAQLTTETSRSHRQHAPLALVIFDIDNFKSVNDRYGHAAGDAVLQHVANVALNVIRDMDTLGRFGGEEFLLIAPDADDRNAVTLAERVRVALRSQAVSIDQHEIRVTASFGIAILRSDDMRPDALLGRADAALYVAKAAGRDRVVLDGADLAAS